MRTATIVLGALALLGAAAPSLATQAAGAATAPPPPHAPVPAPGTGALTGMGTELASTDDGMPPGVVNGPCTPAPAHPYPVVLVHGTGANENFSWQTLAPMLSDAGYCVFGLNYGATAWTGHHTYGLDYIEHSAAQLESFVAGTALPDTVEPTGNAAGYPAGSNPTQVDMVGHSQGGMMPRYLIESTGNTTYPGLGDAAQVHTLIGLAPSNYGSSGEGLTVLGDELASATGYPDAPYQIGAAGGNCGACAEQEQGSPFLAVLNASPTVPGVAYYVVETSRDEVVTPYTNAFLPAAGNVVDVTVQDQCPTDATEHLGIIYDPVALQDVVQALRETDPAASGAVAPLPQPSCPPVVLPVVSG